MRKKTFARKFAVALLLTASSIALAQNSPAKLTLHPDQPTTTVSPTLYGLMTEEINYSYDGGLYFGVTGDYDSSSDIDVLTAGVQRSVAELLRLSQPREAPAPKRSKSKSSRARSAGTPRPQRG